MSVAVRLIRSYGFAIRCYWGEIDGRTVRSNLNYLADILEGVKPCPSYEKGCELLNICPRCEQWVYDFCDCKRDIYHKLLPKEPEL